MEFQELPMCINRAWGSTLLLLILFNRIQAQHSAAPTRFSNMLNAHLQALFNIFHTLVCTHFLPSQDWVGQMADVTQLTIRKDQIPWQVKKAKC